jgi:hypothetical protein
MVNVEKSYPAPECLAEEKKKKRGNYKCGNVLERLKNDFRNKCYICEYKYPPGINVEHFVPHKGNKKLKFDWDNLFLACVHCNNTKLAKPEYNNILNCTSSEHDVVNWIRYEMKFIKTEIKITALKNDEIVKNTVQLLDAVYNGTTPLKKIESSNIRKSILDEIGKFQYILNEYFEAAHPEEKNDCLKRLKRHLKASSPFTAFKHWIIKENEELKRKFEQYFG